MLIEQDSLLGGALLSSRTDERAREPAARDGTRNRTACRTVEILRRTTALGLYDGNMLALLTRAAMRQPDPSRGEPCEVITTLCAKAIVFATGAIERPLVFGDNDRPGVMLASAAQSYLNRYAVAVGRRIVVATNNDAAWYSAADLARGGAEVTVVDQRLKIDADAAAAGGTIAAVG